jgi:membrane-associated phospholipid phosphatase
MTADAHDAPYFRQTTSFSGFNRVFAGSITNSEILIAPASFYLVGLFDKDAYARKTGLLAGEALADVTVLSLVMKGVTQRLRPSDIPPYGDFSDTFFKKNKSPFSGSFPSGHAISAFAVATIIASRYGKRHRWVPFAAYGAAAVIGFSRVTTQAHFPSDVFLGAALGFAVAQFDVLRAPGYGPVH